MKTCRRSQTLNMIHWCLIEMVASVIYLLTSLSAFSAKLRSASASFAAMTASSACALTTFLLISSCSGSTISAWGLREDLLPLKELGFTGSLARVWFVVDLSDDASSGSDILRSPLSSDSCTAETPSTCVSETLSVSRPSLILLDSSASEDLLKSL